MIAKSSKKSRWHCRWCVCAAGFLVTVGAGATGWSQTTDFQQIDTQPVASKPPVASKQFVVSKQFGGDAIIRAFAASCNGFSSDELLIRDDLRESFLRALRDGDGDERTIDAASERFAMLRLLQLRKAGKLTVRASRRGAAVDDSILPVAEIAARVVTDRHRITSDTMLADPDYRRELQREAELIVPDVDAYLVRKAVLSLRKKRALRPELVLRVAEWQRELLTLTLDDLRRSLRDGAIAKQPGVYLFRSQSDYLYIGEAANLAARMQQHVTESDRASLAEYLRSDPAEEITVELHIFPADSPAAETTIRRAYESELIRSRKPRFNVRP